MFSWSIFPSLHKDWERLFDREAWILQWGKYQRRNLQWIFCEISNWYRHQWRINQYEMWMIDRFKSLNISFACVNTHLFVLESTDNKLLTLRHFLSFIHAIPHSPKDSFRVKTERFSGYQFISKIRIDRVYFNSSFLSCVTIKYQNTFLVSKVYVR